LLARVAELEKKYVGGAVPRPLHWSGYRLAPDRIEFWRDRPDRLHDRHLYVRDGAAWTESRLNP
jgi:pyridoxamine 5'-phosphate oxidase